MDRQPFLLLTGLAGFLISQGRAPENGERNSRDGSTRALPEGVAATKPGDTEEN